MEYVLIDGQIVPEHTLIKENIKKYDTEYRLNANNYRILGEAINEDVNYILPPTSEVDGADFLFVFSKQGKKNLKMRLTAVGEDKIINAGVREKYLFLNDLYDHYILKAVAPLKSYIIISNPLKERN